MADTIEGHVKQFKELKKAINELPRRGTSLGKVLIKLNKYVAEDVCRFYKQVEQDALKKRRKRKEPRIEWKADLEALLTAEERQFQRSGLRRTKARKWSLMAPLLLWLWP